MIPQKDRMTLFGKMLSSSIGIVASAIVILLSIVNGQSLNQNISTNYYHEVDTVLNNPGKGWMVCDGIPANRPRFPTSVAYQRFNWKDVQPQRNLYRWDSLDTYIAAYKSKRVKFAFRLMTTNPQARGNTASPQWLYDLGCKSNEYVTGGAGTFQGGEPIVRLEPDYADSIFLAEHAKFISELGKRYDGSSDIEFVDIGSYGIWGEWHTQHPVPFEVKKKIIDMYLNAFKKTRLIMLAADPEGLAYALSKGTGLRRDGVGSLWDIKAWSDTLKYPRTLIQEAWKKAPVVFEWYGYYNYLVQCAHCSLDAGLKFMYDNHVTYITDNIGRVPDSVHIRLRLLGEQSGYRFVLNEVSHSREVRIADTLVVKMNWSNIGIAPLYKEYYLSLSLLDAGGSSVLTHRLSADLTQWLPGKYSEEEMIVVPEKVLPGTYTLGVAMVNALTHTADIRFPMNAVEKEGVYSVGSVTIK